MNNENRVRHEDVLYFDIIFYVRTPDGLSKIIINIEAQKSEPSGYDVEMRGIFYAAREVSSQLEREFSNQQYNNIKKVYSIWICMNEPENTLEKISLTKQDLIGQSRWKEMYELINVVIVRLKKTLDPNHAHELHRLLGTLFLPEIEFKEKSEILEEEFHIQMEDDRKEMLGTMCNLSQGIKENAMQQGRQQGLQQGRQQGLQQGAQQARIEAVENMLRANIPEQTIRSMGYTEEELSSAKQNISVLV
jgi:predicted transposase/invertase (TIGR01784 family)